VIYILFGPPGVGKTHIGKLASQRYGIKFFDADDLINQREKIAIASGKYTQPMRDVFVEKLITITDKLHSKHSDLIIAEAFTKETNRVDYRNHFSPNTCFIRVTCPLALAKRRIQERMISEPNHIIDLKSFKTMWAEFDPVTIPHKILKNTKQLNVTQIDQIFNQHGEPFPDSRPIRHKLLPSVVG